MDPFRDPGTSPSSSEERPSKLTSTHSDSSITTNGTSRTANASNPMHYVKALYDFAAKEQEELPMEEEDIIAVPSMVSKGGWLFGENNGAWGWFPESYVRVLTEEEAAAEGLIPSVSNLFNSSTSPEITTTGPTDGLISPSPEPSESSSTSQAQSPNKLTVTVFPNIWFSKYKTKTKKGASSPNPTDSDVEDLAPLPNPAADSTVTALPLHTTVAAIPVVENKSRASSERLPTKNSKTNGNRKLTADSIRVGKGVSIVGSPAETKKTWADFVGGPEAVEKLQISKQERKRQEVIFEIVSTERDYVEDLETIIDVYIKQLKRSKLIRPKDMSVIFSNIEAMSPVNKELLKSLDARQAESQNFVVEQVGDIFIGVSDYLKMYTMYCSNHPYALMKLQALRNQKNVAKFLDQCASNPECKNFALSHFLLKPVQRICKYPLLLREVLRNTDAEHPDYANLQKALLKIETVVTIVNEGSRQAEVVHKMIELQNRFTQRVNIVAPSRILKKSGTLDMIVSNERKRREIFLFNDMLLMAKQTGGDGEKLKLVAMVPFDMILVNSLPEDLGNLLEIVHINASKFVLEAESREGKDSWVSAFQEATDSWMALKKRGAGVEVHERVLRTATMTDVLEKPQQTAQKSALPPLPKKPVSEKTEPIHEEETDSSTPSDQSKEEASHQLRDKQKAKTPILPRAQLKVDQAKSSLLARSEPFLSQSHTSSSSPQSSSLHAPKPDSSNSNSKPTTDSAYFSSSKVHLASSSSSSEQPSSSSSSSSAGQTSAATESASTLIARLENTVPARISSRIATNYFIVQDLNSTRLGAQSVASLRCAFEAPASISSSSRFSSQNGKLNLLGSGPSRSTSRDGKLNLLASGNSSGPGTSPSISPSPSISFKPLATASRPVIAMDVRKQQQQQNFATFVPEKSSSNGFRGQSSRPRTKSISDKIDEVGGVSVAAMVSKANLRNSASSMDQSKNVSVKTTELSTKKPNINRPVKSASIVDVNRKAERNNKEFTYTTRVQFVGQTEPNVFYIVQHTYEDFFDFHLQLIGHFPEEAGLVNKKDAFGKNQSSTTEDEGKSKRIIPELPGQMMVVSEAVAKTRIDMLQDYVEAILSLPPKISRSPLTMQFFRTDGKHALALQS
ncbi:Myosin 10A, isoform D [Phlyctochytrium planicorne]|nr:Myosin 10A, isoform D [Phlyctochytrium planicorne]